MRIIGLVMGFMLIASFAFADVTAEIIAKDIDDNGNILVKTQYKVDGVEIPSRYPKLDGKYYWVTRYNVFNFIGMTEAQIQTYIVNDVNDNAQGFVKKAFMQKKNKDIHDNHLKTLKGSKTTATTGSFYLDTNGDGILDKEWIVKTDGSYVEKTYTPIINP